MFLGLHLGAQCDHRKVLKSIPIEGLEIILQAFAVIGQKIAETYMDVLLKEAAHQIVLVSEALRLHSVRSKQQSRRFDSAAANQADASFRRSLLALEGSKLYFLDGRGRFIGDDRGDVRVQ